MMNERAEEMNIRTNKIMSNSTYTTRNKEQMRLLLRNVEVIRYELVVVCEERISPFYEKPFQAFTSAQQCMQAVIITN